MVDRANGQFRPRPAPAPRRILPTVLLVGMLVGLGAAGYVYRAELHQVLDRARAAATPEDDATIDTMRELQEATAEREDRPDTAATPSSAAPSLAIAATPKATAAPAARDIALATKGFQRDIDKSQAVIDRNVAILTRIQKERILERYRAAAINAPKNSNGNVARVSLFNLEADIATAQRRIAEERAVIAARQKSIDAIAKAP